MLRRLCLLLVLLLPASSALGSLPCLRLWPPCCFGVMDPAVAAVTPIRSISCPTWQAWAIPSGLRSSAHAPDVIWYTRTVMSCQRSNCFLRFPRPKLRDGKPFHRNALAKLRLLRRLRCQLGSLFFRIATNENEEHKKKLSTSKSHVRINRPKVSCLNGKGGPQNRTRRAKPWVQPAYKKKQQQTTIRSEVSVKIFPTTSLSSGTVNFPSPGARNALCQVLLNITCLGPSMTRMEPFLAPGTVRSPSEKKWSLFRRSVLLYLKISNCRISQLKVPSLSVQLGQD